jgi:hypothetical protein
MPGTIHPASINLDIVRSHSAVRSLGLDRLAPEPRRWSVGIGKPRTKSDPLGMYFSVGDSYYFEKQLSVNRL